MKNLKSVTKKSVKKAIKELRKALNYIETDVFFEEDKIIKVLNDANKNVSKSICRINKSIEKAKGIPVDEFTNEKFLITDSPMSGKSKKEICNQEPAEIKFSDEVMITDEDDDDEIISICMDDSDENECPTKSSRDNDNRTDWFKILDAKETGPMTTSLKDVNTGLYLVTFPADFYYSNLAGISAVVLKSRQGDVTVISDSQTSEMDPSDILDYVIRNVKPGEIEPNNRGFVSKLEIVSSITFINTIH